MVKKSKKRAAVLSGAEPAPQPAGAPQPSLESALSGPALKRLKKAQQNTSHSLVQASSHQDRTTINKVNNDNEGRKLLSDLMHNKKNPGRKIVVVLEKCFLELVQVRKGSYELLNADDHKTILLKNSGKASLLAEARPDITHQCLMTLLDSPLNKVGKLLIYVHTNQNQLIEVHPSMRVPRTFRRFAGLMVELLQKGKIRAAQTNEVLLKIIANPVEKYLPDGGKRIGLSVNGERVTMKQYVERLTATSSAEKAGGTAVLAVEKAGADAASSSAGANETRVERSHTEPDFIPPVFVVGGVAHCDPVSEEKFGANYVEEKISISPYGLSASCVCSKICNEFENVWGI